MIFWNLEVLTHLKNRSTTGSIEIILSTYGLKLMKTTKVKMLHKFHIFRRVVKDVSNIFGPQPPDTTVK